MKDGALDGKGMPCSLTELASMPRFEKNSRADSGEGGSRPYKQLHVFISEVSR